MGNSINSQEETQDSVPIKSLYNAIWRWHFYAGLYVIPFVLMLSITGLLQLYIGVIDGRDGEYISVTPANQIQAYSSQAQAAVQAIPDGQLVEWIGQTNATGVSVFRVKADGIQHMVGVNPYTSEVVDTWIRRDGWYDLLKEVHGTLLIGDTGDILIEIAAGFGIVLILSGLYLWWPQNKAEYRNAFVPNFSDKGRPFWKSLHMMVGFYGSIFTLLFLISGMAWTGIWGEKITQAWSTFPAEKWDNVPLSDDIHASMNHGAVKDVPWGLEQTPMPASGSDAGTLGLKQGEEINFDNIITFAREIGYKGRFHVNFPSKKAGVWTIAQDSMSNDSKDPMSDRTVHIDQYTGKILADIKFEDYSIGAKSMAISIALHEGDLGLWNIILNTVYCLSLIFLAISGIIMWWIRRPAKSSNLSAPPAMAHQPLKKGVLVLIIITSMLFPLVGLSLITVLLFDIVIIQRIPSLARAIS